MKKSIMLSLITIAYSGNMLAAEFGISEPMHSVAGQTEIGAAHLIGVIEPSGSTGVLATGQTIQPGMTGMLSDEPIVTKARHRTPKKQSEWQKSHKKWKPAMKKKHGTYPTTTTSRVTTHDAGY